MNRGIVWGPMLQEHYFYFDLTNGHQTLFCIVGAVILKYELNK